jgi:hypothetical protein
MGQTKLRLRFTLRLNGQFFGHVYANEVRIFNGVLWDFREDGHSLSLFSNIQGLTIEGEMAK